MVRLLAAADTFAKQHYCKDGETTQTLYQIQVSLRPLRKLYGRTSVADFGPKRLRAIQGCMVEDGLSRGVVNKRVGIIKQVFQWGVSEELVPPSVYHGLQAVSRLKKGRTEAPDHAPIPDYSYDLRARWDRGHFGSEGAFGG